MTSLQKRLLTAAVGIPFVVLLIFLPYMNHIALCLLLVFATGVATYELKNNVLGKKYALSWTAYLGALLPVVEIANRHYLHIENLLLICYLSFVALSGAMEVKKGEQDNFKSSMERIGASILCITYPGLFMSFTTWLTSFEYTIPMTLLFLAMVFGSDSFAFFTGILFGKNNKGILKASPNKSVAGFLGGTILVSLVSLIVRALFPTYFNCSYLGFFCLTLVVAIFGTIGDLFESLLKRSCGVKDAGNFLPGMGGMLDRIDSISFAAPIFIVVSEWLFK